MGAVTFGVIALILCSGFIEWIYWAMREQTIHSGLGHVHIIRPGYFESGLSDPLSYLLPAQSPELSFVERLDGLETIAPRLTFYGLISFGDATLSFQGVGIQPEREGPLSTYVVYNAGGPMSTKEDDILLGEGLAENLGAKVGDRVVLLVNTPRGGINAVEATVRGLFSTVTKASDDVAVRLPISLAHRLLRVEGSTEWLILLKDTDQTTQAVATLTGKLDARQFSIVPWTELADFYNKTIVLFSKQVAVLKLIIVLTVILAIANSMTIAVVERTGEIGTVLALGLTRKAVWRRFLVEGLMQGFIGAAIGLLAGVGAAAAISRIGIPMPPPPGMSRGYVGEILVTPGIALQGALMAVACSVVAAILPAWRASRMIIVDAIRKGG